MGFTETLRTKVWNWLQLDSLYAEKGAKDRMMSMALNADYYFGNHRPQFKVRMGQADDNIFLNFTRLVVDRAVTMLLGNGIEFVLPGENESANKVYIDQVWTANHKDVLLQKAAKYGALYGTCYIKMIPESLVEPDSAKLITRLVVLNPLQIEIIVNPDDIEQVMSYIIRYNYSDSSGKEVARKQTVDRVTSENGDTLSWLVSDFISQGNTAGWQLMNEPQSWSYTFAPIIHWQNLPNPDDCYGMPDIDDNIIQLQDRINFVASNISKIIRYHAHPKTWARGTNMGNSAKWGADELITLSGENAMISNLEMQSDLSASMAYMQTLRQTLFDLSQTVDLDSIQDKLGSLTNFGLHVLYLDAESKLGTKQEVWNIAMNDLNSRLLQIGNVRPSDGGYVEWPDILPVNKTEQVNADKFELDYKLASKQTVSERRGYDYQAQEKLINAEQASGDNVGAAILRAFNNGQQQ
jgi:hypothetical protein